MKDFKKLKANRLGLVKNKLDLDDNKKDSSNTPSISFKTIPDLIEVNKTTLLEFLISGSPRWGENNITINLINNNKELTFTTLKWDKMDYGFTMRTKITPKKAGKFNISFKANNIATNSLIFEAKYILKDPEIVEEPKQNLTEEQKAKLITTVYGEAARDANLMVNIHWIYFNLTKRLGFEKGLKRSSFYRNPKNNKWVSESYKICMFYLGQGNQFKDDKIVNGMKVKDFCKDSHSPFVNRYKHNLDIIRSFCENNIFNPDKIMNPYYKWEGQGYWGDMDFRINNSEKTKWAKASQYFHLQNKGYVTYKYIREFVAYDGNKDVTTYLCDDNSIEKYFKNNPNNLPKFNNNDYSTIPRVHIPKDLK
jgi:hypothetical protein